MASYFTLADSLFTRWLRQLRQAQLPQMPPHCIFAT